MESGSVRMSIARMQRARASIAQQRRMTPKQGKKDRKVAYRGWLQKRGPTHDYGWERVWAVLTEEDIDCFENDMEETKVGEIPITEYTQTCEFKKKEAPGEAAKYVKSHPSGWVIDTEPFNGPKRMAIFYVAAENDKEMAQWMIALQKASKQLKNLAPPNRTSLAEFVALWDAPIVLVSSPDLDLDKAGHPYISVPAVCAAIVGESSVRVRTTMTQGDKMAKTMTGWFGGEDEAKEEEEKSAFPLHRYFTTPGLDCSSGHFVPTRVRSIEKGADGKEEEIVTAREDLDNDFEALWKGPGPYNQDARMHLAVEHSFAFAYWRGMVMGALASALVAMGDKPLPLVNKAKETKIGKLSQASAQGLRIGDSKMPIEEFDNYKVRIVIAVSIEGSEVEAVQRKHIPRMCKEVIKELKKNAYPWAEDAWTLWCNFPSTTAFIKSLAGCRNLVPDHTSGLQIGEDDENKPLTYQTHKLVRQPPAPSLLGGTDTEDLIGEGVDAINQMVEGLLGSCDEGNIKQVRSILDKKCHVGAKDDSGMSAISVAAGQGHAEIVRELLKRNADVETTDAEGDTVLTVAVGEGVTDVVKLLLEVGADRDVVVAGAWVDRPDDTVTLTEVAKSKGFTEICNLLKPKAAPKPVRAAAGRPMTLADELNFDAYDSEGDVVVD